jgi:hypothetical protein
MPKEDGLGFTVAPVETWRKRMRLIQNEYALDQPLVVVVGSGLSWDREEKTGVADVQTLVRWIRELGVDVSMGTDSGEYQAAINALKDAKGARAVSLLIRRAILEACSGEDTLVHVALGAPSDSQKNACKLLEQRLEAWTLPRGVLHLGNWLRLIVEARRQRPSPSTGPIHVVTTNFDPLIEIALDRVGVKVVAHSIPHENNPSVAACEVCVWHVHGSWWDVTLHSPEALKAHRNALTRALEKWMQYAQICILGYGGWQDVISTTIADTLATFGGAADVLWAFFEDSAETIREKYDGPLQRLSSAPAFGQTTLFCGVDLHGASWEVANAGAAPIASRPGATPHSTIPEDLLERLRAAVAELLKIAPSGARAKLTKLLDVSGELPDLCVVLGELCFVLKPISACEPRKQFARAILDVLSALSACVLRAGPRETMPSADQGESFVVESSLIAELRMAAEHQRPLRLRQIDSGIAPADAVDDCILSTPLECGPADADWVEAFARRFWAMDYPHIDFDRETHGKHLDGLLEAKKLLHQERFAITGKSVPVGALRQQLPHARFFIRGASGVTSPAIREHTLATLIQELLKLSPELSPDVSASKASPL